MQQKDAIQSISIIGAGNVGWHLANAFKKAGCRIRHIISRNMEKGTALSILTGSEILTRVDQVMEEPDLYLLCTQDGEIEALAKSLASSNAIVAHTSGGISINVFKDKPGSYGVFYPLQTFTRGDEINYAAIPFLLEGSDPETMSALQGLAEKISGNYHLVDSPSRMKVHLAAVFACNFSNHMAAIAYRLLDEIHLDPQMIKPLMDQTLKKLEYMSPSEAQTGPAIRRDEITMKRHMELLSSAPELLEIYLKISRHIAKETDIDNNE